MSNEKRGTRMGLTVMKKVTIAHRTKMGRLGEKRDGRKERKRWRREAGMPAVTVILAIEAWFLQEARGTLKGGEKERMALIVLSIVITVIRM